MATARVEDFSALVKEAFGYLTGELGYSLTEDRWRQSSASWVVSYSRPDRIVELVWGLKDVQFYFRVLRMKRCGNDQDWFYIFQLMHHLEPECAWVRELDIGISSPTLETLAEKVNANARVLRENGGPILAGEAWFDRSEGSGVNPSG